MSATIALGKRGLREALRQPDALKADLREHRGGDPTLDDVFLDATGRTRDRAAGEVQEVAA